MEVFAVNAMNDSGKWRFRMARLKEIVMCS